MRMIWRTITMITSITMGTFSNTLHLIERTPGLFVPLLVKVVPVVWLNRVLVVRSHVTWVKSSRLQCYQRKKGVFWSSANPNTVWANSTCCQVSRHLSQVSWVKIIRGSFGLLKISTGQRWKPDEVLVARDPAEAEPKWTKSNGNIISPEILVFIFQLDTQANTSIWYHTNLKGYDRSVWQWSLTRNKCVPCTLVITNTLCVFILRTIYNWQAA